jgi:hypothetical protein
MARLCTALVLAVAVLPSAAQVTTAPGTCFAFNSTPGSFSNMPLVAGGELYFGFTAPVAASVERIDLNPEYPAGSTISAEVFQASGTTLGPLVGSGVDASPQNWVVALVFNPPLALAAGSSYALRMTLPSGSVRFSGDSAQPTPLSYLLNCGATPPSMFPPCSSYPVTGTFGAMMTFRSSSCGQLPNAVATMVGAGCGAGANFSTNTPPVLGAPFTFWLGGFFYSGSCQVFWAAGAATLGLSVGISNCTSYLDPVSLQALAATGQQPLLSFPITGTITTTTVNIPLIPALAGTTVTTQAVLYLAAPSIPTPFGNLAITNALQLTFGY